MPSQKRVFIGASTNGKLAEVFWMTRRIFWIKLMFHSLFITASVVINFEHTLYG